METKTKKTTVKKTSKVEIKEVTKPEVSVTKKTMNNNKRKTLTGTVVSTKMTKTVVVAIERKVAHKKYGKLIKVTKRLKADTNGMEIKENDIVVIEQTRPMSKDKNFKVVRKEEAK